MASIWIVTVAEVQCGATKAFRKIIGVRCVQDLNYFMNKGTYDNPVVESATEQQNHAAGVLVRFLDSLEDLCVFDFLDWIQKWQP